MYIKSLGILYSFYHSAWCTDEVKELQCSTDGRSVVAHETRCLLYHQVEWEHWCVGPSGEVSGTASLVHVNCTSSALHSSMYTYIRYRCMYVLLYMHSLYFMFVDQFQYGCLYYYAAECICVMFAVRRGYRIQLCVCVCVSFESCCMKIHS